MTIFYVFAALAAMALLWAMWKNVREKDYSLVPVQLMLYCVMTIHMLMLFREYYLGRELETSLSLLHSFTTILLLPTIFVYVYKRFGAEYKYDVAVLLITCSWMIISRANLSVGLSEEPMTMVDIPLYRYALYVNGKFYSNGEMCEVVLLQQVIFAVYKMVMFGIAIRKKNFHFSKQFRRFCILQLTAMLFTISTFIGGNDLWQNKWYSLSVVVISFVFMSMFYIFMAMRYDINPLEDENNEPVMISEPSHFSQLADLFRSKLESGEISISDDTKMEDVARMLGTNRTYVARMMKEEFNTTFAAFMNARRIQLAKEILRNNPHNSQKMMEVAIQCGFSSASAFNKVFKTHTGVTPGEYAKMG